jgi:nucleoside-diphosphate-sugar epimerase
VRVLVTGAGGFIGAQVVKTLLARGHRVIALDRRLDVVQDGVTGLEGDLADPALIGRALSFDPEAVIHLAALPGGAAEQDPALSRRINLDASLDLLEAAGRRRPGIRFVYASTIAVFGDPLPAEGVNDDTPTAPRLIYGAHKAMMETAIGALSRRGHVEGVCLRLPGVVARPRGAAGLKSAFMSDLFHSLKAGERFVSPVGPEATLWLMSVVRAADNLVLALDVPTTRLSVSRVVTLPALRVRMDALLEAVRAEVGASAGCYAFDPDPALQAAFGAHPPLKTPVAESLGFSHDGDLCTLVQQVLRSEKRIKKHQ